MIEKMDKNRILYIREEVREMNQFELKSVMRELNGLKDFADKALDVIRKLVEENEILVEELKKRQFDQASYIPVKDIAKDMKCSIQTVINLIHSGQLKGKKAGRRWMVAYEDYLKFKKSA